jgi:hypothetical protein
MPHALHKTRIWHGSKRQNAIPDNLAKYVLGGAILDLLGQAFDECLTVTETAWPKERVQQVRSNCDEAMAEIAWRFS